MLRVGEKGEERGKKREVPTPDRESGEAISTFLGLFSSHCVIRPPRDIFFTGKEKTNHHFHSKRVVRRPGTTSECETVEMGVCLHCLTNLHIFPSVAKAAQGFPRGRSGSRASVARAPLMHVPMIPTHLGLGVSFLSARQSQQ